MTDEVAPWADEMAAVFGLTVDEASARGRVRRARLGQVTAFRMTGTPQSLRRAPAAIREAEDTPLKLCAVRSGEVTLRRDREGDLSLSAGQMGLYNTGLTYELHADSPWVCTVMTVPRELLTMPPRTLAAALAHRFPEEGTGAVLTRLLDSAVDDAGGRPDAAVLLGHATVNLLAGLTLDHERPIAPDEALRAGVLGHIRAELGDPDLGAASICAALGLSRRTLYRLFEGQEWSLAETIRNLRLDAVRADLRSPHLAGRSIMAIAAGRGFRDQAHLTRSFKARYGVTPAAARREALGAG